MKFISQLFLAFLFISVAFADDDEEEEKRVTCTDRLNDPEFRPACIKMYCKCMFNCDNPDYESMAVDANGKTIKPRKTARKKQQKELSVMECFKKNGCDPKADVESFIHCTSCIMDKPKETETCQGYQIGRDDDKKKK